MESIFKAILGIIFIVSGIGMITVVITSNNWTPQGQLIWISVFVGGAALIWAGVRVVRGDRIRDIFEDFLRAFR